MNPIRPWSRPRRDFLKRAATCAGALVVPSAGYALKPGGATPITEDGPLYPADKIRWANDLTTVAVKQGAAVGEIVYLHGQIVSGGYQPVTDAVIEIWQADHRGYYRHPRHSPAAILDPNFRYFAKVRSNESGHYLIKTIVPGGYRMFDINRAAHIHIKVKSPSHGVITSEIYFSGAVQNRLRVNDPIFQSRPGKEQLIADRRYHSHDPNISATLEAGATVCNFDIMYST